MSVDKQNEAIVEAQNTVTGTQQALIASAEAQQAHDLEVQRNAEQEAIQQQINEQAAATQAALESKSHVDSVDSFLKDLVEEDKSSAEVVQGFTGQQTDQIGLSQISTQLNTGMPFAIQGANPAPAGNSNDQQLVQISQQQLDQLLSQIGQQQPAQQKPQQQQLIQTQSNVQAPNYQPQPQQQLYTQAQLNSLINPQPVQQQFVQTQQQQYGQQPQQQFYAQNQVQPGYLNQQQVYSQQQVAPMQNTFVQPVQQQPQQMAQTQNSSYYSWVPNLSLGIF